MPGRVLCAIALGIVAVHALAVLVGMALDKPEPARMRLEACPDIEVSVDALRSVARAAATSADVMVEDVRARVVGRNKDGVEIKVDAIALTSKDLKGLAHRVQSRVQAACDDMLGVSGVRVQVCFLPSKTTTVTKEVMR
ncbi:MAG: hypothetical protein Q4B77_06605 [Coriobacteriaceae bacterium]|nr:hypothetical protein [Coriobacteriaceae bacterium]